jgi:hypothetical protein
MLYPQCVDGLVSGFFRCDYGIVIGLAALQTRVYKAFHQETMPRCGLRGGGVRCWWWWWWCAMLVVVVVVVVCDAGGGGCGVVGGGGRV